MQYGLIKVFSQKILNIYFKSFLKFYILSSDLKSNNLPKIHKKKILQYAIIIVI